MEELDVTKMVFCPDREMMVDCANCCGCDYYHGMGNMDFTMKCGFADNEKNGEEEE
jgi:hypothetical protein